MERRSSRPSAAPATRSSRRRWWTSSVAKLGLISTAIFAVAIGIVFLLVLLLTTRALLRQLEDDVLSDLPELANLMQRGGTEAVRRAIELRLERNTDSDTFYLALDARGRPIAGNLPTREPWQGWRDFALPGDSEPAAGAARRVRAFGSTLDSGMFLAVGRDRASVDETQRLVVRSFVVSIAAASLLALPLSFALGFRMLRRLEAISQVAAEIVRGDLGRRVAVRDSGDEFDELALALNAMLDRIAALMAQVRQVTDDIAHDLRTPLARLRHRLDLARARARTAEEYTRVIDGAVEQVDGILEIFTSLLRIAQIEAAARRSGFERVRLDELLRGLAETYAAVAEDRGQRMACEVREVPVVVAADRALLSQMFANLIENAIGHAPVGSTIRLELGSRDGRAEAAVSDEGPGIPPEMRRKVFQRFVRLDHSRTTRGSGLGLSMAAAIADLHGIRLELDDARPGATPPGLTVRAAFPAPAPGVP